MFDGACWHQVQQLLEYGTAIYCTKLLFFRPLSLLQVFRSLTFELRGREHLVCNILNRSTFGSTNGAHTSRFFAAMAVCKDPVDLDPEGRRHFPRHVFEEWDLYRVARGCEGES